MLASSGVPAFQFGERLAIWIVVIEIELAVACYEEGTFSPVGEFWYEIRWAREFDVDCKLVFD